MPVIDLPDLSGNPDLMIAESPGLVFIAAFSHEAKDLVAFFLEQGHGTSTRSKYSVADWEQRRYSHGYWECQAVGPQIPICMKHIQQRKLKTTTSKLHQE